jgi:16S rRNA (cytidine1402-2'-O)-methyltransferase
MSMGKLILCATPIGNLDDLSARAVKVLSGAGVIACEDTRRTRKLLSHLGLKARELIVYNEQTERRAAGRLLKRIERGAEVVLVSDAGMPGLSDPGFLLVAACAERDLSVEVIPGPNAAISALAVSGLPPGRFVFEGFLPRRAGERRRHIEDLVEEPRTLVLYESPHRIEAVLEDLSGLLGPRPAALVRELTKMFEEIRRGTLTELLEGVRADPPRGEIVLVVHGATGEHTPKVAPTELADRAKELMGAGVPRSDALKQVAQETGVPKRAVFDALLEDSRGA